MFFRPMQWQSLEQETGRQAHGLRSPFLGEHSISRCHLLDTPLHKRVEGRCLSGLHPRSCTGRPGASAPRPLRALEQVARAPARTPRRPPGHRGPPQRVCEDFASSGGASLRLPSDRLGVEEEAGLSCRRHRVREARECVLGIVLVRLGGVLEVERAISVIETLLAYEGYQAALNVLQTCAARRLK